MRAEMKLLSAAALFALTGLAFAACGGPPGADVCDARCACEGCSIAGHNDCLRHDEDDAFAADRRGCLPFYDEFRACEAATGFCREGHHWETDCGRERDRWRSCVE